MASPSELRIFISSTFRDLQEEREHLVKKIFPEIRALCRERGITFTEVDLRWGITEEEAGRDGIIGICLDEIDRCRPYFVGILGERYGWRPLRSEVDRIVRSLPTSVADAITDGASITDMEISYGVLASLAMGNHAFFYFRDRESTPDEFVDTGEEAVRRLLQLKDRIRRSGLPLKENFTSAAELGEWVQDDLLRVIEAEFPEQTAPGALEVERRGHSAFARSRTRAYIPNPEYHSFVDRLMGDRTDPVVVHGVSGLGKSSLVAYTVDRYRRANPSAFVIEYYVGATERSGTVTAVMRHIIEEIRDRFAITEDAPSDPEELERDFANWLYRGEHLAKREGIAMLLVLDALNQLDEAGRRLAWLPTMIPPGIRLIVSTTDGESYERLHARGWEEVQVVAIADNSLRGRIVTGYLAEFRKSVAERQLQRITSDDKARSPLYLRVVAEELRLHGEHKTIDEVLERYRGAGDLDGVFQQVLQRLEEDHGRDLMGSLLSFVWGSRAGLSETELLELTGVSRLEMSRMLFALDYHLLRRDGLLSFFHDYLRRAVEQRYLTGESVQRGIHLRLAGHFEGMVLDRRVAEELLWQYARAGEHARQAAHLGRIEVLRLLYDGAGVWRVLSEWARLRDSGEDVEAIYLRNLEEYAMRRGPEDRLRMYAILGDLHERLGSWETARQMYERMVEEAIACGNKAEIAGGERQLGGLLAQRGEYTAAVGRLKHALHLYEELGDRRGVASSQGTLGIVYNIRGEHGRALESYGVQLRISEEMNDRSGIAMAQGNLGIVYWGRGEYDRAVQSLGVTLRINQDLGDWRGAARTQGNLGVVYWSRGEYDRALESYEVRLRICEEVGDRSGAAIAQGHMGTVYAELGEYDRTLGALHRASTEHRMVGYRHWLSEWLGATVGVLLELVDVCDEAPEYLAAYLPEVGPGTWRAMTLHMARQQAEECVSISEELSKPDTLFDGRVLLARITAAEGDRSTAVSMLGAMVEEATANEQRAELHYRLWKLSATDIDHRTEALRLYQSLIATTPKHGYRKRIDELSATSTPETTDFPAE